MSRSPRPSPAISPFGQLVRTALVGASVFALSACAATVGTGGDASSDAPANSDARGDAVTTGDVCDPTRVSPQQVPITPLGCVRTMGLVPPRPADAGGSIDASSEVPNPDAGSSGAPAPRPDVQPPPDSASTVPVRPDVQPSDAAEPPPPLPDVQPRDATSEPPDVDTATCVVDCVSACRSVFPAAGTTPIRCARATESTVTCFVPVPCS